RLALVASLAFVLGAAAHAAADVAAPLAQLATSFPEIFPRDSITGGSILGAQGVRLIAPSIGARGIGLVEGDVILAVDGKKPGATDWTFAAPDTLPQHVWLAGRAVPGDRPVLPPAILGRRTLDEFTQLDAAERTPMRLAVMLANHATLVHDGAGVVLLSGSVTPDDATWLRCANPLPPASE